MGVSMLQRQPAPRDRDWDLFFDFSIHDKDIPDKSYAYPPLRIDELWMSDPLNITDVSSGAHVTLTEQDDSGQLSGQFRQDASGNDSHDIGISRRGSYEILPRLDSLTIPVTGQQDDSALSTAIAVPDDNSSAHTEEGLVTPSSSRNGPADTFADYTSLIKRPSKRLKQQRGGYPCSRCNETFDRACDEKKHFRRTHAPKDSNPHSCSYCQEHGVVKTFLYPKDLRRHFKQVHSIVPNSVATRRSTASTGSIGTSAVASKLTIWMVAKALVKFKRLRTSQTHENVIMVSEDKLSFVEVEVSGAQSAAALSSRILSALGKSAADERSITAQTYSRRLGQITLGRDFDEESLYSFVMSTADVQGSLKLLVTITERDSVQLKGKSPHNKSFDDSVGTTNATPSTSLPIEQSEMLEADEEEMDICEDSDRYYQRNLAQKPQLHRQNLEILHLSGKGEESHLLPRENFVHGSRQARSASVQPRRTTLRSHSEPPFDGSQAVKSCTTSDHDCATAHAPISGSTRQTVGSCPRSWMPYSMNRAQRKRNDDDDDDPNTPRTSRKLKSCSKIFLPCPYHVGPEASEFVSHYRRHEHFSILLRHLICHDKYFCPKCITDFGNAESLEQHKKNNLRPCQNVCDKKRCRRRWPAGSSPPRHCICILTQEQQWRELYERIYPDEEIPDISLPSEPENDQSHMDDQPTQVIDYGFGEIDMGGIGFMDSPTFALFESIPLEDALLQRTAKSPAHDSVSTLAASHDSSSSPAVSPTNQRTSAPVIVIGALWQMLADIAPLRTQRDSPLWQVVQAHTPGFQTCGGRVLSTTEVADGPTDEDFTIVCGSLWQTLGDIAPERTRKGSWLCLLTQKHAPGLISCTEPVTLRG
ncbi:hypothetical protein CBER1_08471 [Cercospora berteroae]|uniref:C2H2-type domain-containing protein n=1 Tax=Cercospora berteroae TaxID=357750 RepID=A0A2S6CBT2_9PEZI|nr:hypothetical protein CBER1_08471 [Cercospora berteroae]